MEYDFLYYGDKFILDNNNLLDEYDTVMTRHPKDWGLIASSVYYCFNTNGLDEYAKNFDEEEFIEFVRNTGFEKFDVGQGIWTTNHARMTENLIPIMFAKNNRKTKYLDPNPQDQTEDSHDNNEMKWVFPVYNKVSNSLDLFINNNLSEDFTAEIQINEGPFLKFTCKPGYWTLNFLDVFDGDKIIKIWSGLKLLKTIKINESNREKFIRNSFINFK
jgi:hypothetical protein